jgi:hypothetical protein
MTPTATIRPGSGPRRSANTLSCGNRVSDNAIGERGA